MWCHWQQVYGAPPPAVDLSALWYMYDTPLTSRYRTGGTTHGWFTVHRAAVRPMEFLDFTSVTLNEFQQLVPPSRRVPRRMAAWRMDGNPDRSPVSRL